MRRVEQQRAFTERLRAEGVRSAWPYFAHLRLDTGFRETDVLLAQAPLVLNGLTVLNWVTAPLAELYFSTAEGESYELDLGNRVVRGRLLEKNTVEFRDGQPCRIEGGELQWCLGEDGTWRESPAPPLPTLPPRDREKRRPFRSPLEVRLDPAQQAVVDRPAHESVLLLGEAGFGKTTVGLHRLVALRDRAQGRFTAAVVVPTEGLRRLTELMLERRGVTGVDVRTWEDWATRSVRRVFRDLPQRLSVNTPTQVARLKRHPALAPVLEAFVRRHRRPLADDEGRVRTTALASRQDLHHLFGDRAVTGQVVLRSGGALPARAVEEAAQHTKIQFLDPADKTWAHVHADSLITADGRGLDDGTPTEDAGSADLEDCAVMFELERLRAETSGRKPTPLGQYDCVLVDEAQEFAPLELRLLRRILRPGGTVIVAGDAAQQVDPTAAFEGWDRVMAELGAPLAHRAVLGVNYRCPPDVTALARSVLREDASPAPDTNIQRVQVGTPFHLAAWLSEGLQGLLAADPSASIAVIARTPDAARNVSHALRHALDVRLAFDGDFDFRPGVTVTCVQEVKGLEFDHVVVPDAGASTYADTPDARRALYVAVTRATHRIALLAAGAWSPLLSPPPAPPPPRG
ncbi:MAG: ATP-binding domain-containing protein [Deltaproteobacteria bacterium]|nr:ATP-binding domain-containing protein [Deltaproteobacteria bacterium]